MGGNNQAAIDAYKAAIQSGDMSQLSEMLVRYGANDFVDEWPQSGERIRGMDNMKRLNDSYSAATGTSPKMVLRRVIGEGDVYVIEGTIDYGDGVPVSYVGIAEFRDGKVTKMTEYFANPFEAPEWRKQYVERMEPVAV
jgi:ketosteroid isomerase-like protein